MKSLDPLHVSQLGVQNLHDKEELYMLVCVLEELTAIVVCCFWVLRIQSCRIWECLGIYEVTIQMSRLVTFR